jgi:hypothetical protein
VSEPSGAVRSPTERSHEMKYMLLIYGNEGVWSSFGEDDLQRLIKETDAHNAALQASGEFVGAYGVADQVQAKQVTIVDGAPVVTDGPYLEAKEYIGSFNIVDCESPERALEIAAQVPFARFGQVEVRPILHEAGAEM